MKKNLYFLVIATLLFLNSPICNGQFNFEGWREELPKLKTATLYVAIDQNEHTNNPEYAKIIEENWVYSKVEIIAPNEVGSYLKEGNFFLTLTVQYDKGYDVDKPAALQAIFSLTLWTPNPKYLKKILRKNDPDMEIDFGELALKVASIGLVFDKSQSFKIADVLKGEYFGNGYALYSGLGIFKNYLIGFQDFLKENKKYSYKSVTNCNEKEIMKLNAEILYVPSTALIDNSGLGLFSYKKNKKPALKASSIFVNYPAKYQVINIKDLNQRILANEDTFYYISLPGNNELTVTNSKTAEVIFKQDINAISEAFSSLYLKKLINLMEGDEK